MSPFLISLCKRHWFERKNRWWDLFFSVHISLQQDPPFSPHPANNTVCRIKKKKRNTQVWIPEKNSWFRLPWTWWILCESQMLTRYFGMVQPSVFKTVQWFSGIICFLCTINTCKQQLHWKIFQFVSLICSLAFQQFQVKEQSIWTNLLIGLQMKGRSCLQIFEDCIQMFYYNVHDGAKNKILFINFFVSKKCPIRNDFKRNAACWCFVVPVKYLQVLSQLSARCTASWMKSAEKQNLFHAYFHPISIFIFSSIFQLLKKKELSCIVVKSDLSAHCITIWRKRAK